MKTIPSRSDGDAAPGAPGRRRLPPPRTLVLVAIASGGTAAAALAGLHPALAFLLGFGAAAAAARVPLTRDGAADDPPPRPLERRAAPPDVRALIDSLPAPLLAIGASGRIMHANPSARSLLPRLSTGAHYASAIRAPEFVTGVAEALDDGRERTLSFAASPGRERIFGARLSPLAPGSAFGDEARLLVQIEDRTEVSRTEKLRSDFIANASHELRTPLASIIGYIETLQHHARDDAAARERFLTIMEREAGRMQRLVDDLMSLSRIEMSEHVRPQELCALTDIAAEAASALQPLAESQGITLAVAVPDTSPVVPGDRDQLYQVFTNLIDNAIKYAGRGSTVRVSAAPPSRAFPNRAGVMVADDGPGIAREHLSRLTERFYRANVGQSRNKGGTGLGLAIVKHILNRHEGRLEIVSAPGKGSAFTAWLPRADAADRQAGDRQAGDRQAGDRTG